MTPENEAPVAQPDEQLPPTSADPAASAEPETQEPAASAEQQQAPVADDRDIKLQERFRKQGSELKQTKQLALQQAQELAALKEEQRQIREFLQASQAEATKARVAQMDPDERLEWLTQRAFQPAAAPQPIPPVVQDPVAEMQAFVEELNAKYDLEEPMSPEDVGMAANKDIWRQRAERMARMQAVEEGKEIVPAKKAENTQQKGTTLTEEQIIERAAQKLRQEMGIGRPNTANAAGTTKGGASIESLNKMAAQAGQGKSPRAIAEEMRKLQTA